MKQPIILLAPIVMIGLIGWSSGAEADFSYTLGPQKNYVGIVKEIGGSWKFLTCDNTALDLVDGAALTFRPDLKCVDEKAAASSANGESSSDVPFKWVPTETSSCETGPKPNPNPNMNRDVLTLVGEWNALQTGSTTDLSKFNAKKVLWPSNNQKWPYWIGMDNLAAVSDKVGKVPPDTWNSSALFGNALRNSRPKYYGGVMVTSNLDASSIDCDPKPRDPKSCPNCSERFDQFLDKETDWQNLFYTDNYNLTARAVSALQIGHPNYSAEDLNTFVDLSFRKKITRLLVDSLGANQQ